MDGHAAAVQLVKDSLSAFGIIGDALDVGIVAHVAAHHAGGDLRIAIPRGDDHFLLVDGHGDGLAEFRVRTDEVGVLQVEAHKVLGTAGLRQQLEVVALAQTGVIRGGGAHDHVYLTVLQSDHAGGGFGDHAELQALRIGHGIQGAVLEALQGHIVTGDVLVKDPGAGADLDGILFGHGLKGFLGQDGQGVGGQGVVEVHVALGQIDLEGQLVHLDELLDHGHVVGGGGMIFGALEGEFHVVDIQLGAVMEGDIVLQIEDPVVRRHHFPVIHQLTLIFHGGQVGVGQQVMGTILHDLVGFGGGLHGVDGGELIGHGDHNLFFVVGAGLAVTGLIGGRLCAAADQREHHDQAQQQSDKSLAFHSLSSLLLLGGCPY